jgi:hypothetical protein
MDVDHILNAFNQCQVEYILIGGMNFLLRHLPVITFDVDLWVEDTQENLERCNRALALLDAEWGPTEDDWGPVAARPAGWLASQAVFCLTSPSGPIDVFRSVKGLPPWRECEARADQRRTSSGVAFLSLSDQDMLACQMALPEGERKADRIRTLRQALGEDG